MPFKENHSVGTKSGLRNGVASHGTDFRISKAKICSLEAMHQDSRGSGFLGTISKSACMCAFFPGNGSIAFIRFAKVSVNPKKVKNTPKKRQHRFQNFCQGCGKKVTLLHCWWECKLVQPLWRTAWRFFKKLKIELPYDPAVE